MLTSARLPGSRVERAPIADMLVGLFGTCSVAAALVVTVQFLSTRGPSEGFPCVVVSAVWVEVSAGYALLTSDDAFSVDVVIGVPLLLL